MGFLSNLFSKTKVKKIIPNKLQTNNSDYKSMKNIDSSDNTNKAFTNKFLQFFRTSRMVDAYQNTNIKKIDRLLSKGKSFYLSVKFPENNNFSLIHQAISDRNTEIIELILDKKYSADDDIIHDNQNDLGLAPLHLACIYNFPEIIEILIKKGNSNINVLTSTDDLRALHVAASAGSLKSLVYLSENYFLQNLTNKNENEILDEENFDSSKKNQDETNSKKPSNSNIRIKSSFIRKLNNISDNDNTQNFSNIKKKNKHIKSPLDVSNTENWTPLHYACFQNRMDIVSYLLDQRCDLFLQNNQKLSPLALCVLEDNLDLFIALYEFHFKNQENIFIDQKDYNQEVSEQAQLVHIASISKKGTRCLDYLLADPNNVNMICSKELNATPLHFACMKNNLKGVKSLLKYNANVNTADYLGNTPLFYATENGNLEILKLLHEYGADGIRKNSNGINCFQIAMNLENRDVRLFYLGQNQYRHLSEKDRLF